MERKWYQSFCLHILCVDLHVLCVDLHMCGSAHIVCGSAHIVCGYVLHFYWVFLLAVLKVLPYQTDFLNNVKLKSPHPHSHIVNSSCIRTEWLLYLHTHDFGYAIKQAEIVFCFFWSLKKLSYSFIYSHWFLE